MRREVIQKLENIHDGVLKANGGNVQLLTFIMVGGNFINYFVQKGVIYENERDECFRYFSDKIFFKYDCPFPGARESWVYFMEDLNNSYNEEYMRKYRPYIF